MGEVLQFRRPTPPIPEERSDVTDPTPFDVMSMIAACMITGLSNRARNEFNSRLQRAYDRAGNDERRAVVVAAAEWVSAPLRLRG